MRLDNKQVSANILSNGENLILCSNLQEAFFDIYNLDFQGESFIKKAVRVEDGCPIIALDVEHMGIVYENVEFKVQASDADEVFVNETTLSCGRKYQEPQKTNELQQLYEVAQEPVYEAPVVEIPETVNIQELKLQAQLQQEQRIKKMMRNLYHKLDEKIASQLQSVRESLLHETLLQQNKNQQDSIQLVKQVVLQAQDELTEIHKQLQLAAETHTNDAINSFKQTVVSECDKIIKECNAEALQELSNQIKANSVDAKDAIQKRLSKLIESKFQALQDNAQEHDKTVKQLVEQQLQQARDAIVHQQMQTFDENVAQLLLKQDQFVQQIVQEKIEFVQDAVAAIEAKVQLQQQQINADMQQQMQQQLQSIQESVDNKLHDAETLLEKSVANATENLTQHTNALLQDRNNQIKTFVESILQEQFAAAEKNEVVEEATQNSAVTKLLNNFKNQLNTDLQKQAASLQSELYRKFAVYAESMGGGGGSVAVQYANGGTMNGNLTINGQMSASSVTSPSVSALHLSASDFHVDYIDFASYANNASLPYKPGRLFYETSDNTLTLFTDNPNCSMQIGQEMWIKAVNKTGAPIVNGTVVYLSGAQGNRPKMWPALATSDFTSADTIGVVTVDTAINAEGYVTTEGIVRSIDTRNFDEGATLYLSPTVLGGLTDIKPVAPQHLVKIGYALNSTTNGSILVSVDNGYELDELHNVRITNPQNGQSLIYNAASAIWVNGNGGGGGGVSGDYLPLSGGTVTGTTIFTGTLSATTLDVLSANITYIDVKQYELSGFDVTGNVSISGNLSASGVLYGSSSNSNAWSATYTAFASQSANNAAVYTTVQTNSASWNYQGTDIKALTANWQGTYSTVNATSANWTQTLTFNESNATLSISNGNSVSLSALSGAPGLTGDYLPLSGGSLTGPLSTNQDIEITDSTKGIILKSPGGFKYRITVTDAGELVTNLI